MTGFFGSNILVLLAVCLLLFAMDVADDIVDYEVIKKFQQLDSHYSAEKFRKLEERFTSPIIILPTKPPKTMTVKKSCNKNDCLKGINLKQL